MTDIEQPTAERDLGRLEGKTDILLATVTRMEQDAKLGAQLVNDRFVRVEDRISGVEKHCETERQKIKDKLSAQGFRIILLGAAVGASQMPLKGIFLAALKAF